jgi:hypothetical protein
VAPPRWNILSPGSRPTPIRDKTGHAIPATGITSPGPDKKALYVHAS